MTSSASEYADIVREVDAPWRGGLVIPAAFIDGGFGPWQLPTPKQVWRNTAIKIAKAHGVKFTDLVGSKQSPKVSRARQEVMFVLRQPPFRYSLPKIGRLLGRHHTTVLYGIRAHARRLGE